jgi:hypothetical protein
MTAVACTVYEGDYHLGVGALANSLHRQGYRGELWVGWRGQLPPWAKTVDASGRLSVAADFAIRFVEIEPGPPVAQLKPVLMRRIFDELVPDAVQVFFFDSDALVIARWPFFKAWAQDAVALVTDAWFPRVPTHHPWRKAWRSLAEARSRQVRGIECYHGSAFLGVPRVHRALVDAWCDLTALFQERDPQQGMRFKSGDRMTDPFHGTDQDTLAAALMATDVPLCTSGPEAFGFTGFGCVILHPIGPKPWRISHLRDALHGRRPDLYANAFWRHVDAPITVMPPWQRAMRKLEWAIAHGINRFYRST